MKKSVIIYVHILFWITIFFMNLVPSFVTKYISPAEVGKIFFGMKSLSPIFFYLGYFFVLRIKNKKMFFWYSGLGVLIFYIALFLISKQAFAFSLAPVSAIFWWVTVGSLFRFFFDWLKKKDEVLQLEKENVYSKLALLKHQINPHFLFNTLHNIDALIYEDKDKASQSLVKLSDMMRYMLKDTQPNFVSLQNEIVFLENYFALERLRLKNEHFLNVTIQGDSADYKIAPMILIPFVENAFKHTVDSTIDKGIIIEIKIENKKLIFNCENRYDASDTDRDKSSGIGLKTVQKRLDLIYKNRYSLNISPQDSVFKVNLELELNED